MDLFAASFPPRIDFWEFVAADATVPSLEASVQFSFEDESCK